MGFQLSSGEPGTSSPGNAARASVIHRLWHHSRITPSPLAHPPFRSPTLDVTCASGAVVDGVVRDEPAQLAVDFVVVAAASVTRTACTGFWAPAGRKRP